MIVAEPLVPQAFAGIAAAGGQGRHPVRLGDQRDAESLLGQRVARTRSTTRSTAARLLAKDDRRVGHGHRRARDPEHRGRPAGVRRLEAGVRGVPEDHVRPIVSGSSRSRSPSRRCSRSCPAIPQPVAGAVQTAVMTAGIIQAFQQTGRPQPAHVNVDPSDGDLAYWNEHKSTFKAIALPCHARTWPVRRHTPSRRCSAATVRRSASSSQPSPTITAANLSQWAIPGASVDEPDCRRGPAVTWLPDSYLAPLFNVRVMDRSRRHDRRDASRHGVSGCALAGRPAASLLSVAGSPRRSEPRGRCGPARSICVPARCTRSSARTDRARARWSRSWPACTARTRARCGGATAGR